MYIQQQCSGRVVLYRAQVERGKGMVRSRFPGSVSSPVGRNHPVHSQGEGKGTLVRRCGKQAARAVRQKCGR